VTNVKTRKHTEPLITVGKGIGTADCGCGWSSGLCWGGALGATYAWALHVAEYVKAKAAA
jgi:hypothetical protein